MNVLQFSRRTAIPASLVLLVLATTRCTAPSQGGGSGGDGAGNANVAPPANQNGGSNFNGSGSAVITADQKRRAEQITSVFENDTIELQYAYIENINDGRGYTAGRAGFTTATGDLIVVVERYTADVPGNGLAPFIPRLVELAEQVSDSTAGLEGLPQAWMQAAADPRFRAVQDAVVDELYYQPTVAHWRQLGLTTALSLAALYDADIQHGDGDDPDGLSAMLERTRARVGGTPASGIAESTWLAGFLDVRRATLAFAFNPETRAAWAMAVDRPDVYRALLDDGNFDLSGPIVIDTPNHMATIP
ncbi:MAG TPA: chitosanase [Phycisphaerae bacterium]|jgi:chitosanase